MSETIITFNAQNLITVTLMGIIGFAVLRILFTAIGQQQAA